jgi:group I intron endonuclease
MSTFIYKIKNHITNQCYIGKTTNTVQKRFNRHLSNAARGDETYLYRSIRKYGKENFSVEILEETSKDLLDSKEIYYINLLKPEFNMTLGGEGGSTTHNRIWVNNGIENKYILKEDNIPDGFVKGRICKFNDVEFQREMSSRGKSKINYLKVKQSLLDNKVNCKPIIIDNVEYYSRKYAIQQLNITKHQLYKIINANQNRKN